MSKQKKEKYQKAQRKAVPQQVTDRMLKRILKFSVTPLVLGFTTGPTFYFLTKIQHQGWVQPWMFFTANTLIFGAAFVGISYGVLSASWDPTREGSELGIEEFKQNIPILWEKILGKADNEYDASEFDEEGQGDYD